MRVLGDLSRLGAQRTPDKLALLSDAGSLSYGEIDRASNRLARAFLAAGVVPGDRIGLIANNHPVYVIPAQAAAKIGAIIVPLNHRYAAAELVGPLAQAQPAFLVYDPALEDVVTAALATLPVPPRLLYLLPGPKRDVPGIEMFAQGQSIDPPNIAVSPDDPATIMFTSGTTGAAKGVLYGHGAHYQLFDAQAVELSMNSIDVLHISSGLYTNAGINGGINAMMMVGGQGVIHRGRFEPERVLAAVERYRVTTAFWVPTMLAMLADVLPGTTRDLSSLRANFYGSMPMPRSIHARIRTLLPQVAQFQLYGSTEVGFAGVLRPEEDDDNRTARPAYNSDMRIVGADGQPVGVGEVGEIVVHNATAGMMGYWNNPEATAQAIVNGWIRSGDLARQEEGGFFTLVDRARDMIISGAHNIYSSEVEAVLAAHPAIAEVAVFGVPDERYGETVCAALCCKAGQSVTAEELDTFCLEALARYKRPRRFEFHDALPKNPNGKILKRVLREPHWAGRARAI